MGITTVKGRTLNGRVETLPFINPATSEQFGEVTTATQADVTAARQEMAAAAKVWAAKPLKERIRILRKLQTLLIEELDEITAVMNLDNGKSRQDALIEIFVTVDLMTQYAKQAPHWLRRRRISPGLQIFKQCYVEHKPHGVVAVIGPWNYPFVLLVPPIFSALLAGNAVIAKPSEVTGATGVLIENLFKRIPELSPFVRFLHGDGRVGAALVQSKPDLIYLTGSVATGKKIMQAAAENLTPVIFELGSKDPMIVLEDADIQQAAKWGVWGAFYNSGQTCVSVERVYVVEPVYDQFVQAVLAEVDHLQMGYSPDTNNGFHMGPLTFQRQIDIIEDHLQDALAKGAKVIAGGKRDGMFMQPTVMVNVDHTMKLMQDETFGPIMPIMKVADEVDAIHLANHSYMGLGASIWSRDLKRAERIAHQLETGSVNINDTITHFAIPNLPFGGVKQSGNGRAHGEEDLLQFTSSRAYIVSPGPNPLDVATILRKPNTYNLNKAILKLVFGTTPQQKLEPLTELLPMEPAKLKTTGAVAIATGLAITALTILAARNRRKS
ncbi:MAG TPA: aldehyde dehydrogenase family protein [Chloroflexota bacterium]|nr:aldehyde dehydrogenase family protein [Chloroflexota bacterium]HUM67864.1 aldehyde dehydrogenase family protein [Chloroflexota bacterium]